MSFDSATERAIRAREIRRRGDPNAYHYRWDIASNWASGLAGPDTGEPIQYETVQIRLPPPRIVIGDSYVVPGTGLGRSFFGDIGAAIGTVARQAAPFVAVALPIIGSVIPGLGTIIGGALGATLSKAVSKVVGLANKIKPALQTGGSAVNNAKAQADAYASQASAESQNPAHSTAERAVYAKLYTYLTALHLSLDDALAKINSEQQTQTNFEGAGTQAALLANLPPWAVPAAIAAVAVLLLKRR